ncbi:MAG TPA: aldo/keto reductase [Rickettsiales bacterium]|nr:aldo/keto reductase [Rickettsiales bacterium]
MKFLDVQGTSLPALGLGTWRLVGSEGVRAIRMALDLGYRHIDTAQMYENEAQVGQAIKESGIARGDLFITTKIWMDNYARDRVKASTDASLSRLGMDYVDLLLMHWPSEAVKLAETLDAMQELLHQGKTKAIGVSNFPVNWMKRAVEECKAPIACNQVEYHALLSQRAVLEYAQAHNIIVTAYRPLANGSLASNPLLMEIGNKYDKTGGQVALRWLMEQKGVAAVPKAASEKHARENLEIFDFNLTADEQAAIAKLSGNTRLVNPAFAPQWDMV